MRTVSLLRHLLNARSTDSVCVEAGNDGGDVQSHRLAFSTFALLATAAAAWIAVAVGIWVLWRTLRTSALGAVRRGALMRSESERGSARTYLGVRTTAVFGG
jgi:hypothetical protein